MKIVDGIRNRQAVRAKVLVVNDDEDTRDSLVAMLSSDGYLVEGARNEPDASERARRNPPQIILLSQRGSTEDWIAAAEKIRSNAGLDPSVAAVLFDVDSIPEGAEVRTEGNLYLVRSENFNQIRRLLQSLCAKSPA